MTTAPLPERTFPTLNAVRAVGALGVVATHTSFDTGEALRGAHGAFLSRLDFGVALFFVLSGFLLSRPYFLARIVGAAPPSYRHYLWKRGLRILPLYWVTVVAAMLVLLSNHGAGVGTWVRNLTLTQIYHDGLLSLGLTQMWSLCTEVLFYLVLPLLTLMLLGRRGPLSPRRTLVGLVLLAAGGIVWQTLVAPVSDPTHQHYHQWLPGFLPWFAVGMLFAFASVEHARAGAGSRWHLLERWGSDLFGSWLIGLAAFAIACTPVAGPRFLVPPTQWEAFAKVALYTVSAAFLVLPLVFGPERAGVARRFLASPAMTWLGEISYGIFCLHLLVLRAVMNALDVRVFSGSFQTVFILTVAGTIGLAAISFYVLERPFLRLKNAGPFAPRTAKTRPRPAST